MMKYKLDYYSREGRQKFVYANFRDYLKGRVLDVGCDKGTLSAFLNGPEYVGVDVSGSPDVRCDLEQGLPFGDKDFEIITCTDVLEHIENIHLLFDEICRVSRKFIILSLPNSFSLISIIYAVLGRRLSSKYGLPADVPKDRHRWFFNAKEARSFVHRRAYMNGFSVRREFYFYRTGGKLKYINYIAKKLELVPHIFAENYWCLLERRNKP